MGLILPESVGGIAGGEPIVVLLMEQMGKVLYRSPFLSTTMAARLVLSVGSDSPHFHRLDLMASGKLTVSVGLMSQGNQNPAELKLHAIQAEPMANGWLLTGELRFLSFAGQAQLIAIPIRIGDLFTFAFVPPDRLGVSLRRQKEVGRGALERVFLEETPVNANDLLTPYDIQPIYRDTLSRTRIQQAAYLVGLCQGALDATLAYTKVRRQFGHTVASFQANAFRLAALTTRTDAARMLTYFCAWSTNRANQMRGLRRNSSPWLANSPGT